LVKELDAVVEKNADKRLCAFVVVLTDQPDETAEQLTKLAEKEQIDHVPLTLMEGTAGPPSYKISKDAEVTVLLWKNVKVTANHAFASTKDLDQKAIKAILKDVDKMLTE
jgi:CTP:molybdopterin cytidylyltransferase MocA